MKSLVHTIRPWFAVTSLRVFITLSLAILGSMLLLAVIEIRDSRFQMADLLEQSATEMAIRVSKSVTPTVWDVFKRSTNRHYSESFAAGVLDSELAASFALSIHVYASLGSILMAREKLPDGSIHSVSQADTMVTKPMRRGLVRLPIHAGVMTIGHIEVYYTDKYQQQRIATRTYQVLALYSAFTALMLGLLFFLRKSSLARQQIQLSLEQLQLAQEQLVQSEKMASLGNLVAGLAHEVNTPLGIALTSSTASLERTQALQKEIEQNTLSRSALDNYLNTMVESSLMAERGLLRAADLVGHFKQISVDQNVEEIREIDLLEYVEEVISTLSYELRKAGCHYSVEGEKNIRIKTIPGTLAQIITNLTNNALLHAFEGRTDKSLQFHVKRLNNQHVQLGVRDNGKGMDESALAQIYEPFFTTKRGAGGSGLGMHIVFNLVTNQLKGHIQVESEPGKGTYVEINFPTNLKAK